MRLTAKLPLCASSDSQLELSASECQQRLVGSSLSVTTPIITRDTTATRARKRDLALNEPKSDSVPPKSKVSRYVSLAS